MIKKSRQILLLVLLGFVVLLTALLIVSYRSSGMRLHPRRTAAGTPQRRNQELLRQLGTAYSAMEKGEFADAEKQLKEILQERPGHSMVMQLLGQLYYRTERYRKAEAIYRKMVENNEFDASACNNLGQVLYRQGRHREALGYLLRSKQMNPKNMTVYINLSVVYSALNEQELAREMFMEAHRQLREKQRSSGELPLGDLHE